MIKVYEVIFIIAFALALSFLGVFVFVISRYRKEKKKAQSFERFSDEELATYSEVEHDIFDNKMVTKQLMAPDGFNSKPLSYLVVNDTIDLYYRSFTVTALPKKMKFASTWSKIANFENAVSSIFIEPITKKESTKQLDNHINELGSEIIHAEKPEVADRNRARKLRKQRDKTENWADRVDSDEDSLFNVGFLITIRAKSLAELNMLSDNLRMEAAENGGMKISGCYGGQLAAFRSNLPLNRVYRGVDHSKIIKYHLLNKKALASLYNHTKERFVHKNGIVIGKGLFDGFLVTWDLYDPSHTNGFSVCICGPQGVGKSTLMKCMENRMIPFGTKFVTIDSQAVAGKSEYTDVTKIRNGVVYKIGRNSDVILNFLDVDVEMEYNESEGKEKTVLRLDEKEESVLLSLLTIVEADKAEYAMRIFIKEMLSKAVDEVYNDREIFDGDVESLYESGRIMKDGDIVSGKVKKEMPTISDIFKKLLIFRLNESNREKLRALDICISELSSRVKGVYYSKQTIKFFTKEEFYSLPEKKVKHKRIRYVEIDGKEESVVAVEGRKAYFDGQSSVSIDIDSCVSITFDISGLTELEKKEARSILIPYIEDNYVKRNNEDPRKAKQMVLIFDEAHEQFAVGQTSREQCARLARTGRKKNVGIWWATQGCVDFDKYEETRTIFKLSDCKFIFKQEKSDDQFLKEYTPLNDIQREVVYSLNGTKRKGEQKYSKPGEVCIIDGSFAYFARVQIMRETEDIIIETDMRKLAKKYGEGALYWKEENYA